MSLCGAAECLCRDNDYGGVGEKEGSRGLLGRGGVISISPEIRLR